MSTQKQSDSSQPKMEKLEQTLNNGKRLVGKITEKGFSEKEEDNFSFPTKPPQPSVIPFPVARHRSDGPHWAPVNADLNAGEDGGEEENDADYYPISAFANPVQRKEKKGLDFSNWREIIQGDVKKPESKNSGNKTATKKVEIIPEVKENEAEYKSRMKYEGNGRNVIVTNTSTTTTTSSSSTKKIAVHNEVDAPTMIDEIEAENLAKLSQMSTNEIAEAQTEIMEKMNPGLLEMLKKRGREKLGKKKGIEGKDEGSKRSKKEVVSEELKPQISNKSWNVWSERVEKVRDLRFALDGSAVGDGFSDDQLNGSKHDSNQYNAENVAERDFLRTEGDPAALGYTIKEAAALIRSMIPGQRVLALQLLTSVFTKALYSMQGNDEHSMGKISTTDTEIDWQAVWAFALGPEAQMALSLRIGLDDNHDSVVLACAKAIQCILCCDINDSFFNIAEKVPDLDIYLYMAPIFRSKPEIDGGYLHGGFWKYNTKPSNMLPSYDENLSDDQNEGQPTIQDDIVVTGQDVAAGFIRMGILPRICYLLEMDPLPTLEECLLSILVALARHSPTSANAVVKYPRLIESVIKICTRHGASDIPSQIKATVLLKVLSQFSKQICSDFVKHGILQKALWQWYRTPLTLERWVENGTEHCKLSSALMVEQLRMWRVFIRYGYCIPCFADLFLSMCFLLSLPNFGYLIEKNVLTEFSSVSREAYLVLSALAQRLPILHSSNQLNKQTINTSGDILEAWSWSYVIPMVDLAISWLALKNIPFLSSVPYDKSSSCMVWVVAAVLNMLFHIFDRIAPIASKNLPWLPQFVPKIGLEIVRNGFLKYTGLIESELVEFPTESGSLVDSLFCLRQNGDFDASLSSISFLHGSIRLAYSIDQSIQRARNACSNLLLEVNNSEITEVILKEGLIKWAKNDLMVIQNFFMNLVSKEWNLMPSVEMFGRGGPAPGIGFGWGLSQGGFWSTNIFLAQMDANLTLVLYDKDFTFIEGMSTDLSVSKKVDSLLAICLVAGPRDRTMLEKALDTLLQVPVLKYLNLCVHQFLPHVKGCKAFEWQCEDEDFKIFSEALNCHFKDRWLSIKKKASVKDRGSNNNNDDISCKNTTLETIHEDQEIMEMPENYPEYNSLLLEWAHQKLPLPLHWVLSAICIVGDPKNSSTNIRDIAKGGLFLLLGLESMSYNLEHSPLSGASVVWKLHALSMALHANMDVLDDDKSRIIFETLQELYGQLLEKLRCGNFKELLNFKNLIHENYTTFIENLVEQFGAISYGDIIFGRQVALYLHQCAEKPVRLASWNALSNARVLELLPPIEKCIAKPEGYLIPIEEDEGILEAYVKSWSSGALDRAATRESMSFTLALHHISCFILKPNNSENLKLQHKLSRSLLRSYLQKQNQKEMMLRFIRYQLPTLQDQLYKTEIERRLDLLKESCEGNSSLLVVVDKLKSLLHNIGHV